jgi:hypothetical protein
MTDLLERGPEREPLGARLRARLLRRLPVLVAAGAMLVLVAASVALSVRRDDLAGARLRALGPRLDAAMTALGLRVVPERPFARRPCRVNELVGAVESRALRRTYNNLDTPSGEARQVEVAVYLVDDPAARVRSVERALRSCGGFDSMLGVQPYRFTISEVAREGTTLRWRLEGRNERAYSYAHARMFRSGPYVVYVLDHRLLAEPPPGAADDLARTVAAAIG